MMKSVSPMAKYPPPKQTSKPAEKQKEETSKLASEQDENVNLPTNTPRAQPQYKLLKDIGQGSFGKAILVEKDHRKYILKKMALSNQEKSTKEAIFQEIKLMQNLSHLYIVKYVESFVKKKSVCIVMEFAEKGDLHKLIELQKAKGEHFPEALILKWLIQICLGLKYIHDRKVLHRDLKADNIFLDSNDEIKIGDFGISKVMRETFDLAKTKIGTPQVMAPEIFEGIKYNQKSDIWSLGCILYKLQTFKYPFESESTSCGYSGVAAIVIKQEKGIEPIDNFVKGTFSGYSEELKNLTYDLLSSNPNDRPSVHRILQHSLLKQNISGVLQDSIRIYQLKNSRIQPEEEKENLQNETLASHRQRRNSASQKQSPLKCRNEHRNTESNIHRQSCLSPLSRKRSSEACNATPPKFQLQDSFLQSGSLKKSSELSESLKMVEFKLNYPLLQQQNLQLKEEKEKMVNEKERFCEMLSKALEKVRTHQNLDPEALRQVSHLVSYYKFQ